MENNGEQFLHQKIPNLHKTPPVEHEQSRLKLRGEKVSQKPADKLASWMDVLEKTHLGHRTDTRVADRIKGYYHKKHVIKKEDIPDSYFDNQRRIAREQGHGDIEITDSIRDQSAEVLISDQKSSLDNWLNYFTMPDTDPIPMWAKYWAFTGMLKLSTFDKEKHEFGTRTKGTVAPFPDLNRQALSTTIDAIVKKANKQEIVQAAGYPEFKKLLEGANFGKLYAFEIEKITPTEEQELQETRGEWKKYPKGSDYMILVNSLQGHATGWCTAGEGYAKAHLKAGDFYVYNSYAKEDLEGKPTIPRVAIRMEDDKIAEVRGIAHQQNLDPYINDVAEKKLTEFGQEKDAYKKKTTDMKRLTEIDNRHRLRGEELSKDDLRFLYELDTKIEGFGYQKDPRISELLEGRDIKSDISFLTGYSKEQISTTKDEALSGGIKFHYGHLNLNSLRSAEGLKLPKFLNGGLSLPNLDSAEGLKLPNTFTGDLDLAWLPSAEGLNLPEILNGNLYLGNLRSAEGLKLPKFLNGDLYLDSLRSAEKEELRKKYPKLKILPR